MGNGAEDFAEVPNLEEEVIVADGDIGETIQRAWETNIKAMFDSWQSDAQQQARQRQGLQDKLNEQHLRFVEDQHTLLMRTADSNALLTTQIAHQSAQVGNRTANNAATLDVLIGAGEVDTTAQGVAGLKLGEEFRSAAKQAIEAAVAAVPGTSAASQGTTGVAQGALQGQVPVELAQVLTNNITVQTALLATLGDINAALKVILATRTGETTKA